MKIGVYGAGAIGCLLGGSIASNTRNQVLFVGRQNLQQQIANKKGIELTSSQGLKVFVREDDISFSSDPAELLECDVIMLCMKLTALEDSLKALLVLAEKKNLNKEILLIAFQNGVRSLTIAEKVLKGRKHSFLLLGGIVSFGVLWKDTATFHQSTDGAIFVENPPKKNATFDQFIQSLEAGFPVKTSDDIRGIMYGKLLVNLVNAVNACSGMRLYLTAYLKGIPTGEMLTDYHYRAVWGASLREGLEVMKKAGIRPANVLKLPIKIFPLFLSSRLIFWVFQHAQKVDKKGYSSMSQDLQKKRETEIDYINGEIVQIAEQQGTSAKINQKIIRLVKKMEKNNIEGVNTRKGVPKTGKELAKEVGVPPENLLLSVDALIVFILILVVYFVARFEK